MLADPNEVHAWVRATQDAGALREIYDLCGERVAMMQTPKVSEADSRRGLVAPEPSRYVHEQQHTMGGAGQPVMTGPSPAGLFTTSTREQAIINNSLVEEQHEQGRLPSQQTARVTLDGTHGVEGNPESEKAAEEAAAAGKDPLAAAAAARKGSGGSMGVLPATPEGGEGGTGEVAAAGAGGEAAPARGTPAKGETLPGSGKEGPKVGKHTEGTDKAANRGHK